MAPITRSQRPKTPSPGPFEVCDYTTTKKARVFDAYDARKPGESIRSIAAQFAPSIPTGSR